MRLGMKNAGLCGSLASVLTVVAAVPATRLCPQIATAPISPEAQREILQVEREIDAIESMALSQARTSAPDAYQRIVLLGKLMYFDKNLSVRRNETCSFCHMPNNGFTGPVSALNLTTAAYPGSVRTRSGNRKPMSHNYATYAPQLHYTAGQGDFVGGNFWDMRATGIHLNSPAAEQAQGPPLNPVEMGLSDPACVVYRLSQSAYRSFAERVWGSQVFAIHWPDDVARVCDTPGPPPATNPLPVHLSPADRASCSTAFDLFARTIATFEASAELKPFTSKFDAVMAGQAKLTSQEEAGYKLFRSGRTHCNECHRDGGPGEEPLFTDFTASNLGVPRNPALAFYDEEKPDQLGYVANPLGMKYVDLGVGGFLQHASIQLSEEQNPSTEWEKLAPKFTGKFQVPTCRNVDARPSPGFVKAYMHNGYFKSLKEVVHFYNTRDTLPQCQGPHDPRERTGCWPPPEFPGNENKRQLGNLGLTDEEENELVAFLKTLTDGYSLSTETASASGGKAMRRAAK
jgi:cytochrome c peroxidase